MPDRQRDLPGAAETSLDISVRTAEGAGEAEAKVVVAVVGVVVVTIGRTAVGRVVVPATPAIHPVRACKAACPVDAVYHFSVRTYQSG